VVSSQRQVAAVYGVAARTVKRWVAQAGWPGGHGPYDLEKIGPWVEARHAAQIEATRVPSETTELERLCASHRQKLQLELQERQGQLVSRPELEATLRESCSLFGVALKAVRKGLCADCGGPVTHQLERARESAVARLREKFGPIAP